MTAAQIKSVALFYYFALLDEDQAERATQATVDKCRSRLKVKKEKGATDPIIILINEVNEYWLSHQDDRNHSRAVFNQKSKYILPPGISFGAWKQFHKESAQEDLIAIIWSRIIGVEEGKIAQGLGLTTGTVKYRIGKGLRQLGHLITLGEVIA
jgi:hypothetical protein